MNKNKAISIINRLIDKIKTEDGQTFNWELETKTYIGLFFGLESKQYEYMKNFRFASQYSSDPTPFLNNCIEMINNIGLYKEPKKNFLETTPNWIIMLFIPFLFSIGLAAGKYSSDLQNIELTREIKILKDSLSIMSSNKISQEIKYPNESNDSIKNNIIHD